MEKVIRFKVQKETMDEIKNLLFLSYVKYYGVNDDCGYIVLTFSDKPDGAVLDE